MFMMQHEWWETTVCMILGRCQYCSLLCWNYIMCYIPRKSCLVCVLSRISDLLYTPMLNFCSDRVLCWKSCWKCRKTLQKMQLFAWFGQRLTESSLFTTLKPICVITCSFIVFAFGAANHGVVKMQLFHTFVQGLYSS